MNAPDKNASIESDSLGEKLFQFALIADTHVNEEERKTTSTYATNALANGRARFVFESIAQLDPQPAFAVHLGDIVHPVPVLPTFEAAVERFKAIAAASKCPLYLIPGNHDVGDKVVEWMPAGTITADHVEKYRRLFGPDYYAFDEQGCRFLALDAQLINSGLSAEQHQRAWFEDELKSASGRRVFVFIHYPPYVTDRHESGTYDNIDEPGRSWLLALIEKYRPEALFAGHVHNFWYDRIGFCQMYLLPATSFLRHDYTELFRVAPAQEFGRNDTGKFGYFLVDVYQHGHVAHFVRTGGAMIAEGEKLPRHAPRLPSVHTRTNVCARVGIDLRHPWAERVEIAATGGVQEFERKIARNDYPTLALWEMGVRKLRVPVQDLLDARVRERMRVLRAIGHEFLVYCYDLPADDVQRLINESNGLVSGVEVVMPRSRIGAALPVLQRMRSKSGVATHVSKLRTHEDAKFDGSKFSHFINHGYIVSERDQVSDLFSEVVGGSAIDGVVFRVSRKERPLEAMQKISAIGEQLNMRPLAYIRLAGESPADAMNDDVDNACRVAETVFASFVFPRVTPYIDTLMDVDRGYFPRTGFIDRSCNPRLASRVYANLHAALGAVSTGEMTCLSQDGYPIAHSETHTFALLLPADATHGARMRLSGSQAAHFAQAIDLNDGTLSMVALEKTRDGYELDITGMLSAGAPRLLIVARNPTPSGHSTATDSAASLQSVQLRA